jgi:hypothetical protein
MDRSTGLSEAERNDLLARIDSLLGDTPKGRLVRELVENLPPSEEAAVADTDVPEAD